MKVLIVVDMQNDFVTGVLSTPEAQTIVPNVVSKIEEYRKNRNPVILTRDTHFSEFFKESVEGKKLPMHCAVNSDGWDFVEEIRELAIAYDFESIEKEYFVNSYELHDALHFYEDDELEAVELVGLFTDICVLSHAIISQEALPYVPIIVDASCCAGSTPEAHKKALELMRDSLLIDVVNFEE